MTRYEKHFLGTIEVPTYTDKLKGKIIGIRVRRFNDRLDPCVGVVAQFFESQQTNLALVAGLPVSLLESELIYKLDCITDEFGLSEADLDKGVEVAKDKLFDPSINWRHRAMINNEEREE